MSAHQIHNNGALRLSHSSLSNLALHQVQTPPDIVASYGHPGFQQTQILAPPVTHFKTTPSHSHETLLMKPEFAHLNMATFGNNYNDYNDPASSYTVHNNPMSRSNSNNNLLLSLSRHDSFADLQATCATPIQPPTLNSNNMAYASPISAPPLSASSATSNHHSFLSPSPLLHHSVQVSSFNHNMSEYSPHQQQQMQMQHQGAGGVQEQYSHYPSLTHLILSTATDPNFGDAKKKYICNFDGCGKSFTTSGHLARHRKLHSGIKDFQCPIPGCTSKFARRDNMIQHAKSHQRKIMKASQASGEAPQIDPETFAKLLEASLEGTATKDEPQELLYSNDHIHQDQHQQDQLHLIDTTNLGHNDNPAINSAQSMYSAYSIFSAQSANSSDTDNWSEISPHYPNIVQSRRASNSSDVSAHYIQPSHQRSRQSSVVSGAASATATAFTVLPDTSTGTIQASSNRRASVESLQSHRSSLVISSKSHQRRSSVHEFANTPKGKLGAGGIEPSLLQQQQQQLKQANPRSRRVSMPALLPSTRNPITMPSPHHRRTRTHSGVVLSVNPLEMESNQLDTITEQATPVSALPDESTSNGTNMNITGHTLTATSPSQLDFSFLDTVSPPNRLEHGVSQSLYQSDSQSKEEYEEDEQLQQQQQYNSNLLEYRNNPVMFSVASSLNASSIHDLTHHSFDMLTQNQQRDDGGHDSRSLSPPSSSSGGVSEVAGSSSTEEKSPEVMLKMFEFSDN